MSQDFKQWIGRTHTAKDTITHAMVDQFQSIFSTTDKGASAIDGSLVGIHWCLSPLIAPMDQLGPDGHPAKGLFLPAVPLPRRMWAGGESHFIKPLQLGDVVTRTSMISDIAFKQGKTGPLCFVVVSHEYTVAGETMVRERQDIVYREAATARADLPPAPREAGETPLKTLQVEATPTLLFRYSALTYNGHRIHYDRDYAMNEEFYHGLVVHGPLQATYGLRLAGATHGALPTRFSYRGLSPLTDGAPFTVCAYQNAEAMDVLVKAESGRTTFKCEARWV